MLTRETWVALASVIGSATLAVSDVTGRAWSALSASFGIHAADTLNRKLNCILIQFSLRKCIKKKLPGKQGRSAQETPGVQVRPLPTYPRGQGPQRTPSGPSIQLAPGKQGDGWEAQVSLAGFPGLQASQFSRASRRFLVSCLYTKKWLFFNC